MELIINEEMRDFAKELSDLILPEDGIIEAKYNYKKDEYNTEKPQVIPDVMYSFFQFLEDHNVKIKFSTAGVHLNGENGNPHIHYHIICDGPVPKGEFKSNNNQRRNRWCDKKENADHDLSNLSVSIPKKRQDPVWQVLAYPWKEGNILTKSNFNTQALKEYHNFLKEYATTLYQQKLALNARNDACVERKKNKLINLGLLCEKNSSQFNSYSSMLAWLDKNYIDELPLHEKPCYNKYKTDTLAIAVHLKITSYSQIILSPHSL